jgi:osmoprotectant transport system permease protein
MDGCPMSVWEFFADPQNWSGPTGIPARVVEQLVMTLAAVGLAAAIALPLGIAAGHARRYGSTVMNLANLGRAIPTFALLLLFASISAIGVGFTAALLALILFALPPIVTNAYTGIASVDPNVRKSGRGMGMSGRQLLWSVEIPLGSALIAAGLRTAVVQTTATATLAAFVGGGGLGRLILDGFGRQDQTMVLAGVICVAVLTGSMEAVMAIVQRIAQPRGIRRSAWRLAA